MKKIVFIFCLFVFVVHFCQIIYFERNTFTTKYDTEYWKDRYEHSQYQLPLSKRIIGDDGLFAYSGYRLIKGDDPFSINVDKPPTAKYLFGLSILLFQNPLYIVLFFGFCTLVVFYFIARHILKDHVFSLFATTILFLDPLFFSQLWITGLDLIQLFFLLLNILLLVNIGKSDRWNILAALGAGLSLGLFIEVKPPIIVPIIFVLETIFLIHKKFVKEYLTLLIGLVLGIFIPYLRFIFLGNGIVEVIKIHKYMASIYLQSELKAHVGAIWLTLITGKFPNIVTGALINVYEWWILWPILTFSGITMAIISFFTKKSPILNKGIATFLLSSLIVFTFIPSYPRYLVLILPFLYLFGISFSQRFLNRGRSILYLTLVIGGVVNSFFFLFPRPESSLNGFYYNISNLYFHDVYQENIVDGDALGLTRNQFRYIANKAFEDAGVKKIEVKELSKNISIFGTTGNVGIGLTYKTQDLGEFYEKKIIDLVQKDGEWQVKWSWDIIFNDFLPTHKIELQTILGKRGSIIDNKGVYLAKDVDGYLLSVNPEKINLKTEQRMLKTFSSYGYKGDVHFQNAYLENVLPNSFVPIMTLSQEISQKEKNLFLSYPGISLTPYVSRVFAGLDAKNIENSFYKECCTRIYSSYNYHGIEGIEGKYDNTLWGYSGGKILMKDSQGNEIKTIFEKDKRDGKDIVLQ